MKWDDYKNAVRSEDTEAKEIIDEAEIKAEIISTMIQRRNDLGLSQRDLAERCGIPQSSLARIETNRTVPKIDTMIKILAQLGLVFTVQPVPCGKKVQS